MAQLVKKNPPANAGDTRDIGSLAWRSPWTEEPGRLQSWQGHKQLELTEHTHIYTIRKDHCN